ARGNGKVFENREGASHATERPQPAAGGLGLRGPPGWSAAVNPVERLGVRAAADTSRFLHDRSSGLSNHSYAKSPIHSMDTGSERTVGRNSASARRRQALPRIARGPIPPSRTPPIGGIRPARTVVDADRPLERRPIPPYDLARASR